MAVTALAAVAALALSGCQNRVGAAALVGDQRISDDRLQTLIKDALASPGVRDALPNSSYKGDLASYRRTVLNLEVELSLAETVARGLDIRVDQATVDQRYRYYEQQSGTPAQFAADVAERLAFSPELFRELVRREVIEAEIGYQKGGVHKPTQAELRQMYESYASTQAAATLSLVQVPDEAAARAALARIQADPAALDEVAKQYADIQQTSSSPQRYVLSRLPDDLTAKLATLRPGDVFSYRLASAGAPVFYVIRFDGIQRPTLESARADLESQSIQNAAKAGHDYLSTAAKPIGVQVNPRYGSWDGRTLSIVDFVNPAVRPMPAPSTPEPSTGGTG
jgi:hypothetical protein